MPPFRTLEFSQRFSKSYRKLPGAVQKQVDKAVALLFSDPAHPGLNAHAIREMRYYWEAYVNRGDRLIYRPEGDHLILVDVVGHDDIGRYDRKP